MAAFDFPSSPTIGQTYSPTGSSVTYTWDGVSWLCSGTAAIPYRFGFFVSSPPPGVSENLLEHEFGGNVSFAANMASQFVGSVGSNPSASFVCSILKNGTSAGSITISTAGVVSVSCGALSFVSGDVLIIQAPGTADSSIADIRMTFMGVAS